VRLLIPGIVFSCSNGRIERQLYEKGDNRLARIQELMLKNNPEYVAKLAVYARNEMYMRSVPPEVLLKRK
jgi:hypothetical protein